MNNILPVSHSTCRMKKQIEFLRVKGFITSPQNIYRSVFNIFESSSVRSETFHISMNFAAFYFIRNLLKQIGKRSKHIMKIRTLGK